MLQKVLLVIAVNVITLTDVRGQLSAVSNKYHDNNGNFAYSLHTDNHRGIAYFRRGPTAGATLSSAPHPAALISRPYNNPPDAAALPPSGGHIPVNVRAPLKNVPLAFAATNIRTDTVPVYPPANRDLLYSQGYIYFKDFLPVQVPF
ncbi:uncharacterized protein LOC111089491 [Limulus polyphemus]|uniref:Uncharacterized protein LOC111089491 n=1 Tax=Limulus polyphemus TaxID=6850 RepID=A0ABM1TPL4_LIMPO|nr:uncharacterized protein LOC111089491 [Limulus polyphemus]